MSRVIALDHGEARCGVAVSDPTGELVTPLPLVERPDTRRGLARVAQVIREREAELVVVGLPLTLAGEEGEQAQAARAFAERLAQSVDVPVELHDERLTTRMADRTAGSADADSVAAAHLLESWLQSRRASA
jgi:putative holliday junction resolvase